MINELKPFYSNENALTEPPKQFLQKVRIERLDLWGNMKDGFDCNGVASYHDFVVPALTEHQYRVIESKARDYMAGRYYAISETKDGFLPARGYEFDWSDERFCDVNYKGITFATITIEEIQEDKPCWQVTSLWRPNPKDAEQQHSNCYFERKRDALDQVRQLKLGGNACYIQVSKTDGTVLMDMTRIRDIYTCRYNWETTKHSG